MARTAGGVSPALGGGIVLAAALAAAALLHSCRPVEVARLYAVRAAGAGEGGVSGAALPLELKAGGGHVSGRNGRLEGLEVDTDAVHKASASCHHGPPITDPVFLDLRASYTDRDLVVEVRWEDGTLDPHRRKWRRSAGGWELGEEDEDGVAILWSRGGGPFGCQEACHMSDFAVRGGSVIDLRAMRLAGEDSWEEVWVWKSSAGPRELLLGGEGFVTVGEGRTYRRLNSAVAADASLPPEARRAGAFGEGDGPRWDGEGRPLPETADTAPAYLFSPAEEGELLSGRAERWRRGWRVVFSRPLEAGVGRQNFRPGETYRFGVALFDGTSTDHHLVRDTQVLELVVPPPPAGERTPGDGEGIL